MNLTTGESGSIIEPAPITPTSSPSTGKAESLQQPDPQKDSPPLIDNPFFDKPPIIIEPSKSWVALNLKDLWSYRELLYFLTWRDVKVRYKQTLLGAAWAVLQPLVSMLIFTLLMSKLAGIDSDNIPYPLFAYAGLLPWTFFSNAVNNSGNSLVNSSNLITKVYFPRLIIPMAAVMAGLVDFAIAFGLMLILMVYYKVEITWQVVMLVPLLIILTMLAIAMGMWMSAINVKYRDVRHALPFLIQLWMYLSPVIYPPSLLPEQWRWVLALNPLTGIIDNFRSAWFGHTFKWASLGVSVVFTIAFLIFSAYSFRRTEKSFADIV